MWGKGLSETDEKAWNNIFFWWHWWDRNGCILSSVSNYFLKNIYVAPKIIQVVLWHPLAFHSWKPHRCQNQWINKSAGQGTLPSKHNQNCAPVVSGGFWSHALPSQPSECLLRSQWVLKDRETACGLSSPENNLRI